MKESPRAKRMARHHRRARPQSLNLVSLMDIFTILVFFLLVNSGDVQKLPASKAVDLPESESEKKPRETVVVLVTEDRILLEGRPIASIDDLRDDRATVIDGLRSALEAQADRALVRTSEEMPGPLGEVTIMGDKSIPYQVLKRVMATVTEVGFAQVSLAVLQQGRDET